MNNAQPHINAEPSAVEQRNATDYIHAVQILGYLMLSRRQMPLSARALAARIATNRLPYSFEPVGDGKHVVPITSQHMIIGYPEGLPATPENVLKVRYLWLPEWGIDRRYLILNSYLWIAEEDLTARSPKARRLLAFRIARALHTLDFPYPKGRYPTADRTLRAEIAAKAQKRGVA